MKQPNFNPKRVYIKYPIVQYLKTYSFADLILVLKALLAFLNYSNYI